MNVSLLDSQATPRRLVALALFVALAFVPAVFGARFAPGAWYLELAKPAWTPPGWVFAPVWTVLYVTIGVAGWLAWRRAGLAAAPLTWAAFATQLVLNGAWSWLFFGLRAPGAALVEIVALWLAILATAAGFWRIRPLAGALLAPYLVWVGFAALLNAAIWRLNV